MYEDKRQAFIMLDPNPAFKYVMSFISSSERNRNNLIKEIRRAIKPRGYYLRIEKTADYWMVNGYIQRKLAGEMVTVEKDTALWLLEEVKKGI